MAKPPPFGVTIFVQDIDKNLEYFTNTLGFREVERMSGPDGRVAHAQVAWGTKPGAPILGLASISGMLSGPEYDFGQFGQNLRNSPQTLGNGVVLYFHVPNVDKVYERITKNGAMIDEPPTDQFWGDRTISVLTPDNYYMTFATPIKGFDPTETGMTVTRAKAAGRRKAATKAKKKSKR